MGVGRLVFFRSFRRDSIFLFILYFLINFLSRENVSVRRVFRYSAPVPPIFSVYIYIYTAAIFVLDSSLNA